MFVFRIMSQRRTQRNPNPRRTTNVPPPPISIPHGTMQPAIDTPNSTTTIAIVPTSSTPIIVMPVNPTLEEIIGISNVVLNLIDNPVIEDFGRDKDLKNLLKNLQPKAFTREGTNVPKILEGWIMSMDDYFALAGYNTLAQGIMGRTKLEGSAKLWWKLHCQA